MSEGDRFLNGLRRRLAMYRDMAAVAEEQNRLLFTSRLEGILALVDRKRVLLAEIETIDRDIDAGQERWPEIRAELGEPRAREARETLDRTREVLAALVGLEDKGCALMGRPPAAALSQHLARSAYPSI